MAVFDVAQTVVANSAGIINGNLDVAARPWPTLETQLQAMGIWELIGLWLETNTHQPVHVDFVYRDFRDRLRQDDRNFI